MKKINENTKVTISMNQLKKLMMEALAPASATVHNMVKGIANSRREKRELAVLNGEGVGELCENIRANIDDWISNAGWWDELPELEERINNEISRVIGGAETSSYSNNYRNNVVFTIEYSDMKELADKLQSVINEYVESLNSVYADELKQISIGERVKCYVAGGYVVISRGSNAPYTRRGLAHPYHFLFQVMDIMVDGIKTKLREAGYNNVDVNREGESEISAEFDIPSSVAAEAIKRKINENTKVTLTLGQLKKLVREGIDDEDDEGPADVDAAVEELFDMYRACKVEPKVCNAITADGKKTNIFLGRGNSVGGIAKALRDGRLLKVIGFN